MVTTTPDIPGSRSGNNESRTMRKNFLLIVTFIALAGAMPLLAACNTTAGAGKDISNTGQAIEKSADKHAP